MTESSHPKRREFLGRLAAGAVAIGLTGSVPRTLTAEPSTGHDLKPSDKWLESLKGKHRQFFDMPNHENGMGLLHVRNYLNTMRDTYHVTHPDVTAVAGLYGMTTMLGFNDAMWQKYGVANPIKVMDGSKAPATSNVFYKAPAGSASLSLSARLFRYLVIHRSHPFRSAARSLFSVTMHSTSGWECWLGGTPQSQQRCARSSRQTCYLAFSSYRRWSWRSARPRPTAVPTCICDLF